mmetsp:Transcript_33002/g.82053  ORF Transcript_33002/g.82053 Transcript_33002/m.82053 type:complete len:231 (+) Transcript_33002:926-1618(+)
MAGGPINGQTAALWMACLSSSEIEFLPRPARAALAMLDERLRVIGLRFDPELEATLRARLSLSLRSLVPTLFKAISPESPSVEQSSLLADCEQQVCLASDTDPEQFEAHLLPSTRPFVLRFQITTGVGCCGATAERRRSLSESAHVLARALRPVPPLPGHGRAAGPGASPANARVRGRAHPVPPLPGHGRAAQPGGTPALARVRGRARPVQPLPPWRTSICSGLQFRGTS